MIAPGATAALFEVVVVAAAAADLLVGRRMMRSASSRIALRLDKVQVLLATAIPGDHAVAVPVQVELRGRSRLRRGHHRFASRRRPILRPNRRHLL